MFVLNSTKLLSKELSFIEKWPTFQYELHPIDSSQRYLGYKGLLSKIQTKSEFLPNPSSMCMSCKKDSTLTCVWYWRPSLVKHGFST